MNTISITNNTYKGVESYAKAHNLSINEAVEKGLRLLIAHIQKPNTETKKEKIKAAYSFIDTIPAKGGKPIPDNERGIDALIEKKYTK